VADVGRMLVILVAGVAIAGPAMAGNVYSWRTQSGDIAFTDEINNVPKRYRDQVVTQPTQALGEYERFSSQVPEASSDYERRLQERLVHLQNLNAFLTPEAADSSDYVGTASLRIGGDEGQVLNLTGDASDAPVIVERIRVMGTGQIATRHDTVVRQGGRTLGIIRGNQELESGLLSNVVDQPGTEIYR
jgi:hypothetical protein